MYTHLLELFRKLNEGFVRVVGADGVDETALYMRMFLGSQCSRNGRFEIRDIIECIEDAEYTNTMF